MGLAMAQQRLTLFAAASLLANSMHCMFGYCIALHMKLQLLLQSPVELGTTLDVRCARWGHRR